MKDSQQVEYEMVHAQIRERLAELKSKGIPKKLHSLVATVRNNHLHPLLREVTSESEDQATFIFNGNPYSIEFKKSSPFSVPTGSRLSTGILVIRTSSDVVLESKFEAVEDEWGLVEFYYKDTTIYRRGDWVNELLKLKEESDELHRAYVSSYFQSKEQLESLRDKFSLSSSVRAEPTHTPVPRPTTQQSGPTPSASSGGRASSTIWSFIRRTLG